MPGRGRPGRLLLSIHHLAVDGVSWRILVPDLAAAWAAIAQGDAPRVGGARHLVAAAGRSSLRRRRRHAGRERELALWSGMLGAPSLSLFDGALDRGRDVAGTAGHLTLSLPAAITRSVADAGAGGISWRDQRGSADRAGGCGCGLVPAAWPRWRPCGAARSGGSRARGGVWRMSTFRARWAGSPAFTRCGWIPARSIWRRRWRAGRRWGVRSS